MQRAKIKPGMQLFIAEGHLTHAPRYGLPVWVAVTVTDVPSTPDEKLTVVTDAGSSPASVWPQHLLSAQQVADRQREHRDSAVIHDRAVDVLTAAFERRIGSGHVIAWPDPRKSVRVVFCFDEQAVRLAAEFLGRRPKDDWFDEDGYAQIGRTDKGWITGDADLLGLVRARAKAASMFLSRREDEVTTMYAYATYGTDDRGLPFKAAAGFSLAAAERWAAALDGDEPSGSALEDLLG